MIIFITLLFLVLNKQGYLEEDIVILSLRCEILVLFASFLYLFIIICRENDSCLTTQDLDLPVLCISFE